MATLGKKAWIKHGAVDHGAVDHKEWTGDDLAAKS